MYKGIYKIAGVVIAIRSVYPLIHDYCADYRWEGEPELDICIEQKNIDFERVKSAREDELEGIPERSFSDDYLETLAVYRKIADALLDRGTILFHGSAIAVDGRAVLFTAKSGTGKSTHTRLWRETFGQRAQMINDDKPLLWVKDDGVLVCGTPWDGKHRLSTNCMVPLEAICVLERGQDNAICPISAREMLPMLIQQSHRPTAPAAASQRLQVLDKLTKQVKFYRLRCNMDPEAARVAYDAMLGK